VEGTCPVCGYESARGDQCEKCATLLDPDQLINPRCKIDGSTPIFKETKHLYLNFEKIEGKLKSWIEEQKNWRKQVTALALSWIKEGLKKRSITRDLKWGVPVPIKGYENKIFYVWFDAPIGYISSTKEWAGKIRKPEEWKKYWTDKKTHIYNFLGKDNIPFHTIFWPAMVIAHGDYNLPYDVVGLQYLNYEGDKISKSKKWGIFCEKVIDSGVDVNIWRYYFTYLIPETDDTEFKWKEFEDRVNGELVGNLGNFIHRTLSFIWNNFKGEIKNKNISFFDKQRLRSLQKKEKKIDYLLENVRLREALAEILSISSEGNKYFQDNEPWNLIKRDKKRCESILYFSVNLCKDLAILIFPYLPKSSEKIFNYLNLPKKASWDDLGKPLKKVKIKKPEILFQKLLPEKIEELKKKVTEPTRLEELFKD